LVHNEPGEEPPDLILDAILGYGMNGNPRSPAADMILWANQESAPVLALDLPSGLDASSGIAYNPTIQASATLTLALPKTGLLVSAAGKYVGVLYLGDIGVPPELYASLGIAVGPIFAKEMVIRLK
jgi:NAD(P)H-hydrate epimerase